MKASLVHGALLVVAATGTGCSDAFNNCVDNATCLASGGAGGGGGSGGAGGGGSGGSTGGAGSGGGGTGGMTGSCDPTAADYLASSSCGVYLSPTGSDATGDGSPANPFASFATALGADSVLYACEGTYAGSVVLPPSVSIVYGGLDCVTFASKPGGRSLIDGDADTHALRVSNNLTVDISGIHVQSKLEAGIWVGTGADLVLSDSDVAVAAGAQGAPIPDVASDATLNGAAGLMGGVGACNGGTQSGGGQGFKFCDGMAVHGGFGGSGDADNSGNQGTFGVPFLAGSGQGGVGQVDATPCQPGQVGFSGTKGSLGNGALGEGTLDAMGFHPAVSMSVGGPGTFGQGAGGGGGAHDCNMTMTVGPGGGGGGSGGCGGVLGGGAGNPGGSAFALVVVNATVTLTNVTLTAGNGGKGGTGQKGQPGGLGGMPGPAGAAGACAGGTGGPGGAAGGGGGGVGGHSMGIAFIGVAPTQNNVTITIGSFGLGGDTADGPGGVGKQGGVGLACRVYDFGGPQCVVP